MKEEEEEEQSFCNSWMCLKQAQYSVSFVSVGSEMLDALLFSESTNCTRCYSRISIVAYLPYSLIWNPSFCTVVSSY